MTSLVLLHGFASSPAQWSGFAPPNAEAWVPILPGHCHTVFPPEIPIPERPIDPAPWRAVAHRLVSFAPKGSALWVGYSLGARLALAVATYAPSAVAGLVLFGGNAGLTSAAERAARARWDADWASKIASLSPSEFARAWEALPIFSSQHRLSETPLQQQRAARSQHIPAELAAAFRAFALSSMPDWRPTLAATQCPVWLAPGAEDILYVEQAQTLVALNSNLRLQPISGAAHNPLLEAADATRALIAAAHSELAQNH